MTMPKTLEEPLAQLLLSIADDKLLLGHRNSDWTGLAPVLEEDIAFSSIAQDEIAHAQILYERAGELVGKTADQLAFGRDPDAYRCATITELPDDFNWALAIGRQLFCDHFDILRLQRLTESSVKPLADLAGRLMAEERIHVEHVDGWVRRLGRGTADSHDRMQEALDALAPVAPMLFELVEGQPDLADAGVYPGCGPTVVETWRDALGAVATEGGLELALAPPAPEALGGRRGHHTEHLTRLLDEMCEVYRTAPNAAW